MHLISRNNSFLLCLIILVISLYSCGHEEPKEHFVEGLKYEGPLPETQPKPSAASSATAPANSVHSTSSPPTLSASKPLLFNSGKLEVQGTFSSYYKNVSVVLGNYEVDGNDEFGIALIKNSTQKIIDLSSIDDGNPSSLFRLDAATPYIHKLPSGNTIAGYRDFGMRFGIANSSTAFVLLDDQSISKQPTFINLSHVNVDSADDGNEGTYRCTFHQTNFGKHEYFINVCENLDGSLNYRYDAFRVGLEKKLINLKETKVEPGTSIDLDNHQSVLKFLRFFHQRLLKVDLEALIDLYAEEIDYYGKSKIDRVDAIQEDRSYRETRDVAIFDVIPSSLVVNKSNSSIAYQAISVVRTKSSGKLKSYLLNMSVGITNSKITSINGKVDYSLDLYNFDF